jgi:hypothetical protein
MAEFGSDIAGVEDVNAMLSIVSSESGLSVSESVARRFLQPRGSLFYDPEYGLDIRTLLADHLPAPVAENAIAAESLKDPRVFKPVARVIPSVPTAPSDPITWKITLSFENELGKVYDLVLLVSEATVEILEAT